MRVEGNQCKHVNVDKITRCRRLTNSESGYCASHLARKIKEDIERDITALKSEAKMHNITLEELITRNLEN